MMDFDRHRVNDECELRSWWERESHFLFKVINEGREGIFFLF